MCSASGFTIPRKTSTVVTTDNKPKTNQILFILLVEADYVFEIFKTSTIKWNF